MLALDSLGMVDQRHPADAALVHTATKEFFGRIDRAVVCRALADAAYNQYLAAAGKRCFIDKTPRYWMVVSFLDALYPEAPHIVLTRNPYAIAASLKSTWGIPLLPESCPPARAPYLADLVLGLPVLAARRDHPKTQVVRYETLVAQPGEEIRRIIIGLGYDPAGITSTTIGNTDYLRSGIFGDRKILDKKSVDDRSVNAWQNELSVEEMQAVTDMVGAGLMIELGYEQEFQRAREAGVVDKGETVTEHRRQLFQAWWNLRSDKNTAAAVGDPTNASQRIDAALRAITKSLPSASEPAVMQEARLLAESRVEQALRLANETPAELQQALAVSEVDRAARLDVIHERDATIATLQNEVARLGQALVSSEADRAARLDVIHERDATIATLQSEVARLGQALVGSEVDRAARLDVIHERDATIAALQSDVDRLGQVLVASEADRAARLDVIHERDATIATLQSEVERSGQVLVASEADRAARLDVIHERDATIATLQGNLEQWQTAFAVSEADRAARLAAIQDRDAAINALKAKIEQVEGALVVSTTAQATVVGSRWWKLGRRLNIVPSVEYT
ncbi:ribosomal protein S20 [Bradyrhizobium sp. GM22.5]